MKTALLITLLALSTKAFATGGVQCDINDANLAASFGGTLSRSIPSAPFNTYGEVTLKQKFLSEEIPTQKVENFANYYEDNQEMSAKLYFEPTEATKHITVQLTLNTKFNKKTYEYVGTYRLNLFEAYGKSVVRTGKVVCTME
jgi:hypothetical protein